MSSKVSRVFSETERRARSEARRRKRIAFLSFGEIGWESGRARKAAFTTESGIADSLKMKPKVEEAVLLSHVRMWLTSKSVTPPVVVTKEAEGFEFWGSGAGALAISRAWKTLLAVRVR